MEILFVRVAVAKRMLQLSISQWPVCLVEHLSGGIRAIYLVRFKLVMNTFEWYCKVTLATQHNFHLSASVFVYAGDGSHQSSSRDRYNLSKRVGERENLSVS